MFISLTHTVMVVITHALIVTLTYTHAHVAHPVPTTTSLIFPTIEFR
jgi:hypothetical protein